jgi:Response regulator containing CheY-like receiver and SARP domains
MIDVILIDDEEPALLEMEFLLKAYPEVNILAKFTNPVEGLESIGQLKPHAVFLDINMPQLDGMTISEKLQKKPAKTDVVFVTAYEEYAVEAFMVEAMDYLLKPVSRERLDQTIMRLVRSHEMNPRTPDTPLEIRCMGGLRLGWAGKNAIKWRTEKEKELFAFLLNNRERELSKDRIIDELWSEYDVDRAVRLLHNSIYYLKKTLREYGVGPEQIHISGRYCLHLEEVWYDRAFIENKAKNRESLQTIEELEAVLELFDGGGYLLTEGWAWAEQDREILQRVELDILMQLTRKYVETGMFHEAERTLKQSFRKNPFEENITYMLMVIYKKNGEAAKAAKHYAEYQKILKDELKIQPQESIVKIYQSI